MTHLQPMNRHVHIREYPNVTASIPKYRFASSDIHGSDGAFGANSRHIKRTKTAGLSPLKVRKTRENLAACRDDSGVAKLLRVKKDTPPPTGDVIKRDPTPVTENGNTPPCEKQKENKSSQPTVKVQCLKSSNLHREHKDESSSTINAKMM